MELTKHVLPKQQLSQRRAGSWVSCTLRTLSVWLGGAKTCPETSHQALALPGTLASPDLGNCVCEHILHPPLSWGEDQGPHSPSTALGAGRTELEKPLEILESSCKPEPGTGSLQPRVLDTPEEFAENHGHGTGTAREEPAAESPLPG